MFNPNKNVIISQTQCKGSNSACHIGKLEYNHNRFIYMYDCGLKIKDLKGLKNYLKEDDKVNLIYLSHLCNDHIRGIYRIKDKIKKEKNKQFQKWYADTKFVLPYVNDTDKFLYFLFIDDISSEEYVHMIYDDILWFSNNDSYSNFSYSLDNYNPCIKENNLNCIYFKINNSQINWVLLPYVYGNSEYRQNIIDKLNDNIILKNLITKYNDIYNEESFTVVAKLLDAWKNAIKNNEKIWKDILKIKNIKKETDKSISNLLSMTLYSGPYDTFANASINYKKNSAMNYYRLDNKPNNVIKRNPLNCQGWMHTGDANLEDEERYNAFICRYNNIWSNIAVMSIPHHGSSKNFNIKNCPNNCKIFIITPHHMVCKKTVITNVPKGKIVYCTLKHDFESTTVSNGIFTSHYNVPELYNYNECPKYKTD